ncbi:MAG: arsenic resistance N-acetyltransferase ArsN2 [Candidatus Competibacteraceae bacterium]
MVSIRKALALDLRRIELLLSSAQLPTGDIERHFSTFFVAVHAEEIIGVGGLENCGDGMGLLRSFVVAPEFRNQGIAARILEQVLADAGKSGISALYLLTATAQDYFAKRGFARMARDDAPIPIQQTSQYANEPRCSTATLMCNRIGTSLSS